MSANVKPIFPKVPNVGTKKLTASDSTALVTLVTGGADGTRIDDIQVTSTAASDIDMAVWLSDGTDDFLLGTVRIPAGAGNASNVSPVSVFSQLVFSNLIARSGAVFLKDANYTLKVSLKTALTSGEYVYATSFGGDY